MPNFLKIGEMVQKLKEEYANTQQLVDRLVILFAYFVSLRRRSGLTYTIPQVFP
jgi:hypothetical protein